MPSAVIERFTYDEATRTLVIRFRSGADYAYFDVPPQVVRDLRAAGSRGRYFARHIRERYATARLVG
jgi:hypothetical protein